MNGHEPVEPFLELGTEHHQGKQVHFQTEETKSSDHSHSPTEDITVITGGMLLLLF